MVRWRSDLNRLISLSTLLSNSVITRLNRYHLLKREESGPIIHLKQPYPEEDPDKTHNEPGSPDIKQRSPLCDEPDHRARAPRSHEKPDSLLMCQNPSTCTGSAPLPSANSGHDLQRIISGSIEKSSTFSIPARGGAAFLFTALNPDCESVTVPPRTSYMVQHRAAEPPVKRHLPG